MLQTQGGCQSISKTIRNLDLLSQFGSKDGDVTLGRWRWSQWMALGGSWGSCCGSKLNGMGSDLWSILHGFIWSKHSSWPQNKITQNILDSFSMLFPHPRCNSPCAYGPLAIIKGWAFFCIFFFGMFFLFWLALASGFWLWLLVSGFGFWLLASHFWHLASGFWLLLAFGFSGFWLRASGFCGFWLGCNSAWIFFIVCMDLLCNLYQVFFRLWVSEYLVFALIIFMFSNLALWLLWLLWMFFFFGFTILCLSIYMSIYPIYIT